MTYTCEGCGTTFEGTADEAFDLGWDTPERFMAHCTCPKCPITTTAWWRIVIDRQYAQEDLDIIRQHNEVFDAANPESGVTLEHTDIHLRRTHSDAECYGEYCTLHNRSNHSMRNFPQHWRGDRMIMERTCPHGVGHPDPDEFALLGPNGHVEMVHGCDGCCAGAYTYGQGGKPRVSS